LFSDVPILGSTRRPLSAAHIFLPHGWLPGVRSPRSVSLLPADESQSQSVRRFRITYFRRGNRRPCTASEGASPVRTAPSRVTAPLLINRHTQNSRPNHPSLRARAHRGYRQNRNSTAPSPTTPRRRSGICTFGSRQPSFTIPSIPLSPLSPIATNAGRGHGAAEMRR
jgi:hypothetical protein